MFVCGLKLFFTLSPAKLSRERVFFFFPLFITYSITSYLDLASLFLSLSVHFLGFLSGALDLPYLLIRFAISFNKTRSWLTTKLLYLHFVGISRTLVFEIVLSYV